MNAIEMLLTSILNVLQAILNRLTPIASMPMIKNVPVSAASTETYYRIGLSLRAFTFKARGGDIQIAISQGESTTEYVFIPNGSSWSEKDINTYIDAVYFQSSNAAAILESITWRA